MRTHSTQRRGYALIEALVLITVLGVMMGLAAGMIHLLLKLDRGGRNSSDLAADMARLADDFRLDAHASSAIDKMTLTMDGGKTVEYLVRPADIVRTLREGDKVRHYDLYRRPLNASFRLEVTRDGAIPFAALVIDRPIDGKENSLYRDFRIEAELGKDQRRNGRSE
jgi:hypothetical protein